MPSRPVVALFLVHEMAAAVLLPAAFVGLRTERLFLAIADCLDAAGADPRRRQGVLYSVGATVTQREVVFGRSTLVAVTLDREVDARVLTQELCIALHRRLLIRTDRLGVIVEVNVLHPLREEFFLSRGRLRWRRWRRIHGHACRRLLTSPRTLGDEMIGGRIGGRHLLRSIRLHGTDAIDAHIRRVRSLPRQRRRHSLINRVRVCRQRCGWRRRRWRRWGWGRSLLLFAGTQHHDGAEDQYKSGPLHDRLFHNLLPKNLLAWAYVQKQIRRRRPTYLRPSVIMTFVRALPSLHFCCLFPTPIWLRVASAESQLLHFGTVSQHGPDLLAPRAARLKHNVSTVR